MSIKSIGGRLALIAAAFIWGSSFIIMKDAVSDVPVFMLLGTRFTIGALVLLIPFFPRLRREGRQLLVPGVVTGLLLLAAYAAQTFGLAQTTPGKNAFLTAVYCVLVPFVSWVLFREKPTGWNWLAGCLCLAGIGLVSLREDLTIGAGDALTLLGGLLYAFHLIALSHYSQRHDPIALTIMQFAVTALAAWPLSFLFEAGTPFPGVHVWPHLLYLAVFASAAALVFQSVGQRLTPPSQAAILLSLESVFGVAFSLLFGQETLTPQLLLGFVLIFFSVIVSETQLSFLRRKH